MIAVSREHPLALKTRIDIKDLYGETLMMVKRGDSGVNDFIRNDLEKITLRYSLLMTSFGVFLFVPLASLHLLYGKKSLCCFQQYLSYRIARYPRPLTIPKAKHHGFFFRGVLP